MPRLRWQTTAMSVETAPVTVPYSTAWRTRYATFALQISFLLGRQLMLGQEPPIYRRSTTAVRRPDRHLPSQELATLAAAEDQDFKPFWLSHALPCLCGLSVVLHRGGQTPRGTERGERGCDSLPSLRAPPVRSMPPSRVAAGPRHAHSAHAPSVGRRCAPRRRSGQSISSRGPAFVPANDQSAGKRRSTRVRYGAP